MFGKGEDRNRNRKEREGTFLLVLSLLLPSLSIIAHFVKKEMRQRNF